LWYYFGVLVETLDQVEEILKKSLLSIRDAAQRIGIDERTLRMWINAGRLSDAGVKVIRFDGRRYVLTEQLPRVEEIRTRHSSKSREPQQKGG